MRVLAITGIAGNKGNAHVLIDAFLEGAWEVGVSTEKIQPAELDIGHCEARDACRPSGNCEI
jgi:multimeric flavodoxin WrbA